jgi:hypothetical protein
MPVHLVTCPSPPLQCIFPVFIVLLFEVNHFFLKAELWVPPHNPLNTLRLTTLFLIAVPGMKVWGGGETMDYSFWRDCSDI